MFLDRLHFVLRVVAGLMFAALMAAVMIQVVTRLALPNPPVWTEEFSRFMLIMIAAVGAGLSLRSGELVGVDLLTVGLPPKKKAVVEGLGMLAVIAFCIGLVPPGLEFVEIGSIQTSSALDWNMFWMHLAVIIAPVALSLACAERLISNVKQFKVAR